MEKQALRLSGKLDENEDEEDDVEMRAREQKATVLFTAGAVAAGGVVLRLGGRGALISALGLDFASDEATVAQIRDAVQYLSPEALGSGSYVAYLVLWTVAKVLASSRCPNPTP